MADFEQMQRRQRILADFGDFAQQSEDLDAVLTEACRLIGDALGTDLAKVLEIETDSQTLLVRAGVGWQPGVVGEVHLPMGEHSSETFAIKEGVPVITPDMSTETRFEFPSFMKEAGVVGVVNVPIFLLGRKAYGLLQVDSRQPWSPDEHDTEFLRTYATILGPVIDRLHKLHALKQATDENQTLLRELQHRIKNNIATITSLVRLRMSKASSEEVRNELAVIKGRIDALRLVHEQVYAARNADRLPLRPYVTQLLEGLLALHEEAAVRLDVQIEDVEIDSDMAIPLGLILNEFTTNSLKYAFLGEGQSDGPLIVVTARKNDGRLQVRIWDNGKGLPAKGQAAAPGFGTGMALIAGLARQIRATTDWASERGAALSLEFPGRK
ncbi:sensor histidine kinase [Sphingomonas endolithica]|uniref:sensor histidine kinase n=1 Tax=Sphingomonas endolithica TaxID=2972485 RepID=UPI0021AF3B33|nr:histidine kinase dimerization/phosphoacceptor domain -containing protein [Sphingomonas sp. ZFBP2030]